MLYANTESGKLERLEAIREDINNFISRLDSVQTVDDDLGMDLLKSCNALCMRVNGSYGPQQELFDNENKRLGDAYRKFWRRIDG